MLVLVEMLRRLTKILWCSLLFLFQAVPVWSLEYHGYIVPRFEYAELEETSLLPSAHFPQRKATLETNLQAKLEPSEKLALNLDSSLWLLKANGFYTQDAAGRVIASEPRPQEQENAFLTLHEFYGLSHLSDEFTLTVGKKRVSWGSGFAANPTDLMNPRKNALNPTLQRTGAWMIQGEMNWVDYAVNLLVSPEVEDRENGLPKRAFQWQDEAGATLEHYLLGARAYLLWLDADWTLMAFQTQRYGNTLEHKRHYGASWSRLFFNQLEFHYEGLWQQGSSRLYAREECVASQSTLTQCLLAGQAVLSASRLESTQWYPSHLTGLTYTFENESLLSMEWIYATAGYTTDEFAAYAKALQLISLTGTVASPPVDAFTERLQKSFLVMNHQRYEFVQDFFLSFGGVLNLQDQGTALNTQLDWSREEWMTWSWNLFGVVTDASRGAAILKQQRLQEVALLPLRYRCALEVKLFF